MYYPQQSPGMAQKLPALHDQNNPWNRQHLGVGVPPQAQPPTSPGYIFTNGALMQHPHMQPMPHHHHQNSLSHYPSPPTHHQQSPAAQPMNTHWQHQLIKYETIRTSRSPHHRARASAMASRGVGKAAVTITNPNKPVEEEAPPSPSLASALAVGHPPSTVPPTTDPAMRPQAAPRPPENTWSQLDMGGVNIKSIPRNSALFTFTFLTCLYLNHNALTSVPPEVAQLQHLDLLDLSGNNLSSVPPEIGMITSLKELYLFDNHLTTIPYEYGTLHRLKTLGVEGNPLDGTMKSIIQKDGTQALINWLRDSGPGFPAPAPRPTIQLSAEEPGAETLRVYSHNILCERAATTKVFGYTPTWALAWEYRKTHILESITANEPDIVCLQEVDMRQFEEYFTQRLGDLGYEGVHGVKSRYKTMTDSDRRNVDGSATFFKKNRFQLVEQHLIEFNSIAMQRQDFKKTDDMFNRVLTRDHIAIVCLLEDLSTGSRIIVSNTHLTWDAAFCDVKLVQTALMMEELEKIAHAFAKYPPRPPDTPGVNGQMERPPAPVYSDGTKIPLLVCGDYNSMPSSGVYDFLANGTLAPDHPDFLSHTYGTYTSEGLRHKLGLKSAYTRAGAGGLPEEIMDMTNFTPGFKGVIDYIWYSPATIALNSVRGEIDRSYTDKVVGFPDPNFPSDHIFLEANLSIKPPRENGSSRPPPVFS